MKKQISLVVITTTLTMALFSLITSCNKSELKELETKKTRAPWTLFSKTNVKGIKSFYSNSYNQLIPIPYNSNPPKGTTIVAHEYSYCLTFDNTTYSYYGTNNNYFMHSYIYSGNTVLHQIDYSWPYSQNNQGSFITYNLSLPTKATCVTSGLNQSTSGNIWGNAQYSYVLNQICP
jgi:hypothetical protein